MKEQGMKVLGHVLVWSSLVLGAGAAVTAYLPTLDAVGQSLPPLTLNAPAGQSPDDPAQPLVAPGGSPVVLTSGVVERLRAGGVKRVRVKEFAFHRWDGKYWFLLALAGLLYGAVVWRRSSRQEWATRETDAGEQSPTDLLLRAALADVEHLVDLAHAPNGTNAAQPEPLSAIVQGIQRLQRTHFDAFVRQAPALMRQIGLAHYVQLMDRFAAAERLLNRAWSAAVDQVADETYECLRQCRERLKEAVQRSGTTS
jgi:hypothetical protein